MLCDTATRYRRDRSLQSGERPVAVPPGDVTDLAYAALHQAAGLVSLLSLSPSMFWSDFCLWQAVGAGPVTRTPPVEPPPTAHQGPLARDRRDPATDIAGPPNGRRASARRPP